MARTQKSSRYDMVYKIEFCGPIRGHHIYKDIWLPRIGQVLCKPDSREEALFHDKFALGVFVTHGGCDKLVGHVPIELSQLLYHFLTTETENKLIAVVSGKRKWEIGLVVPAKFTAMTRRKKFAEILMDKLEQKKDIIDIEILENNIVKLPFIYKEI